MCFSFNLQAQKRETIIDSVYGEIKVKRKYRSGYLIRETKKHTQSKRVYETLYHYHSNGQVQYISTYDDNYKSQGRQAQYYKDGVLAIESNYKDNKREGKNTKYFKDGSLSEEYNYVNGYQVGPFKTYYDNKHQRESGNYNTEGKLDGAYSYHNYKGELLKQFVYANGEIESGFTQKFNRDKILIEKCTYSEEYIDCENNNLAHDPNNQVYHYQNVIINYRRKREDPIYEDYRHGLFKETYHNEQTKAEGYYENGFRVGIWNTFDEDGNKTSVCDYSNPYETSCQYTYFREGVLRIEQHKLNDTLQGPFKEYYENGQLHKIGTYKNNEYDGNFNSYYEDGKPRLASSFDEGKLLSKTFYDTKRRSINSFVISNDTTYIDINYTEDRIHEKGFSINDSIIITRETQYKNGLLQSKGKLTLNLKDSTLQRYESPYKKTGLWTSYYDNGKIQNKGRYDQDKFIGEWITYDEKGKLRVKEQYQNNLLHGLKKTYYPTGKLFSKGEYVEGDLTGRYHLYFENGRLHKIVEYKESKIYNVIECHSKTGRKLDFGTIKNGNGTYKAYDLKTGLLDQTVTIIDGIGKWN